MPTVCPFEVSKFTVTSPSEIKIKKLLPSLTTYLAPAYNTQHFSAFKLLWKKSRKTYWNVKHQAVDLLWKVTVKKLYRLSCSLSRHLCSSKLRSPCWFTSSCLFMSILFSYPCILVYIAKKCVHGLQQSCSMFQKWRMGEQSCRPTVVPSQHVNEPGILTEVLRMYVPIYLIKICNKDIIQS